MERSSNFISLSGLSGILAGVYALIGSFIAYGIVYEESSFFGFRKIYVNKETAIQNLAIIAVLVLVLAISTGIYLTRKKSKAHMSLKDAGFRNLILSLLIPLVAGGIFILILVSRGFYSVVAPAFLIFYGLALINGSKYTVRDINYLGMVEVALGLICALIPGYGLFFWAFGFGVMHILYGAMMYYKYEK
jgi:hypothetical protein